MPPKESLSNKMRVILAYKNFAANRAISHIGLGVTALNTAKVLQKQGIRCEVWPVVTADDVRRQLTAAMNDKVHPTHLVMSAPWIQAPDWQRLCLEFHRVHFAVVSHSNIAFLSADPPAVRFMSSEGPALEHGNTNFAIGANCEALATFIREAYAARCEYLPNLYNLTGTTRTNRPPWQCGVLKVGCFGAVRQLKNHISAGAAAIEVASQNRATLEFYISSERDEGGNIRALADLFASCRFAKLIQVPWESWGKFRTIIADMNLLMQPSFTESFNVVTADGIAEGVPSVVSTAIEWVPDYWQADSDDVDDIARVAGRLLRDPRAASDGLKALESYVERGIREWLEYLKRTALPTGE